MSIRRVSAHPPGHPPLRLRVPGLLDLVLVRDHEQIHWLNRHPDVQRPLARDASWLHRVLARRLQGDLGFHGALLPVFLPRYDFVRAARQAQLEARFDPMQAGVSEERKAIAAYVSGDSKSALGPLVQQWCGKLFDKDYRATPQTYAAGRLLAGWPSAAPWRVAWSRATGRLRRAKAALAAAAGGDLHCIHGTSIGMENLTHTLRALRELAACEETRILPVPDALRACLAAPSAVLRGCARTIEVPFLARPLEPRTLVVFLVAHAFHDSGDVEIAFLADGWSRCPAHRAIPHMLRTVWQTVHPKQSDDVRSQSSTERRRRSRPRPVS